MRFSEVIDRLAGLPMLPIALTEHSTHKAIRLIGVLVYVAWFMPALFVWALDFGVLAIPAMIQDA